MSPAGEWNTPAFQNIEIMVLHHFGNDQDSVNPPNVLWQNQAVGVSEIIGGEGRWWGQFKVNLATTKYDTEGNE